MFFFVVLALQTKTNLRRLRMKPVFVINKLEIIAAIEIVNTCTVSLQAKKKKRRKDRMKELQHES